MKKAVFALLFALTILFTANLPAPASAAPAPENPYDLFGQGNCAYFAWEMVAWAWPAPPPVSGHWDARQWTWLIGEEIRAGDIAYEITTTDSPGVKDLIVWPASEDMPRGHVAFIAGVREEIGGNPGTAGPRRYREYTVLESSDFARPEQFPLMYRGCRYREYTYSAPALEGCIFLTLKEVNPAGIGGAQVAKGGGKSGK